MTFLGSWFVWLLIITVSVSIGKTTAFQLGHQRPLLLRPQQQQHNNNNNKGHRRRRTLSSVSRRRRHVAFSGNNNDNAAVVERVSVCLGELCRCQEERGAEYILDSLQALQKSKQGKDTMPYSIGDTVCLGACGRGAMVCVDYSDGTSSLTKGWEETLSQLQLEIPEATITSSSSISIGTVVAGDTTASATVVERVNNGNELFVDEKENDPTQNNNNNNGLGQDARDRMRAEAAASLQDDDYASPLSPWLKAGGYLFEKAREKMLGSTK